MCMVCRLFPTNSGKGSPPTLLAATLPVGGNPLVFRTEQAPAPVEGWRTPGTQGPDPEPTQPPRANGSTGPRPGDAHPFRRSGQLAPVAGDAPGASTPPRRREPGR